MQQLLMQHSLQAMATNATITDATLTNATPTPLLQQPLQAISTHRLPLQAAGIRPPSGFRESTMSCTNLHIPPCHHLLRNTPRKVRERLCPGSLGPHEPSMEGCKEQHRICGLLVLQGPSCFREHLHSHKSSSSKGYLLSPRI